jgi:hypothetical protein
LIPVGLGDYLLAVTLLRNSAVDGSRFRIACAGRK